MKYKNLTLITINNTLHIKADNLEPVEVDSSCADELSDLVFKGTKWFIKGKTNDKYYLQKGVDISELSDRIEVRKIYVHKRESLNNFVYRAFLLPEKEDKCDGKCVPNECLCEWEDMTKEQVKAEALPSITEKYGKSFEKSYTIEEIKETLRKYIKHVDDCEGSNFISRLNTSESDVKFSELEVKLLEELSNY